MRTHDDYREALGLHALGSLGPAPPRGRGAHPPVPPHGPRVGLAPPTEPGAGRLAKTFAAFDSERAASVPSTAGAGVFRQTIRDFFAQRRVVWTVRFAVAAVGAFLV